MKSPLSCVFLLLVTTPLWSIQSRYDPSPRRPGYERPRSPVDSMLKYFNPTDRDYGCQINEVRKTVLDDTLKEYNWWAAVMASLFVIGAFFVILHQHRENRCREGITSRFVAQAQNSLLEAQRTVQRVTAKHDQLMESLSRASEARSPSAARSPSDRAESAQKTQPQGPASPEPKVAFAAQVTALNKKILPLQQDIDAGRKREDAARDRERNLQRELDRVRRQLGADQPGATAVS